MTGKICHFAFNYIILKNLIVCYHMINGFSAIQNMKNDELLNVSVCKFAQKTHNSYNMYVIDTE